MVKKTAKEKFLNAISTLEIEITEHPSFNEVSDVYYNEQIIGSDLAYDEYLYNLYSNFEKEINTGLNNGDYTLITIKNLKRNTEEIQAQFNNQRQVERNKISSFKYPVPQAKIDFFELMADTQSNYIDAAINMLEEIISELDPDKHITSNGTDLKLKFHLGKKEVATIFLLLADAGMIAPVSEKEVYNFIEKHIRFMIGNEYRNVTALSTQLSQIKNEGVLKPHTIDNLKQRINDASIEMN